MTQDHNKLREPSQNILEIIRSCRSPTGGITQSTMVDWLSLPQVLAVGGTWIARSEDIRDGNFAQITRLARAAREQVQLIREKI